MLIGLKLRLHGFGQIFERSNWLARIRPSLHGIREGGGGGAGQKIIRTPILVQFEPCNIGPRISPGLMVHNSNFSSSENNNERVSWEQGKSKKDHYCGRGSFTVLYISPVQKEWGFLLVKKRAIELVFFPQVSCWFSRKDQRASKTLEVKIRGLLVACCPTREFARRLAFALQRKFIRDMFELTW